MIMIPPTDSAHLHKKEDLAFCVVWSPLPPITWLIPVIGHLGICDSHGVASDFRGPYFVGDDGNMAFGAPTRAVCFGPPRMNEGTGEDSENDNYTRLWDRSIQEANEVYRGRMHNICCDNCHSHVANALNRMSSRLTTTTGTTSSRSKKTNGSSSGNQVLVTLTNWNMVKLAFLLFFKGRFLSWYAIYAQFGPFIVLVLILTLTLTLTK